MAFLDNSGDIILDAVLTDAGRQRMARGNFKITKFALGDEEINYESFNASHPSGSAFYDLDIMQTPVLEAFTNNTSLMKNKLITIERNNILYMPIFKLNNKESNNTAKFSGFDGYYLLADSRTAQLGGLNAQEITTPGILYGTALINTKTKTIDVDQGLDTTEGGLSTKNELPKDLQETAYLVRVDHRLLRLQFSQSRLIAGGAGAIQEAVNASPQFVDDDAIATYYFAAGDETRTVFTNRQNPPSSNEARKRNRWDSVDTEEVTPYEAFSGPLGSILQLIPKTSIEIQSSVSLFNEIGAAGDETINLATGKAVGNHKFIDTIINVVGVTTGYSMDIPIRIIRKD